MAGTKANQTSFKKGQSGNPGGKPEKARNAINAAFLKALSEDFHKNGAKAFAAVAKNKPDKYLELIASILPKETNVNIDQSGTVTHQHYAVPRVVERATELLCARLVNVDEAPLPN